MTARETRDKLLDDDTFVLDELRRLQWFLKLKTEVRYGQQRDHSSGADSVAEHLYGMHIAFHYFWPLEDLNQTWNEATMLKMITWHDVDEIVTGDTIGYDKTETHRKAEEAAIFEVLNHVPAHIVTSVESTLKDYNARQTPEAAFIKAIDKIEPILHLYNDEGKNLLRRMGTTFEQNASIKVPFFVNFPVIMRFYQVASSRMKNEGFFTVSS